MHLSRFVAACVCVCEPPTCAALCVCPVSVSLPPSSSHQTVFFMGTGTAGHPSRAFHNETITIYEPRYVEMFTGKQLQSAQADALLAVADMFPVVLLCFHHQAQQAECKGHRSKCVHCRVLSEHMIFFIVPAPQSDSGVVPSPV